MKRISFVSVAMAVCALALSAVAWSAGGKDYTGPACNNLTGGDGIYSTFGGTEAFLSWSATTEAPTCAKTTYTLYALSGPGGAGIAAQPIAGGTAMACPDSAPGAPPSTSCISWTIDLGPAATAPTSICIYGTSSSGPKVNDRAPDAAGSCIGLVLNPGSSGGGGGFN
jgi:hypothetical protein